MKKGRAAFTSASLIALNVSSVFLKAYKPVSCVDAEPESSARLANNL